MFHNLKSRRTLDNSTLENKLDLMSKNVLYLTHRVDTCVKTLDTISAFMVRINKQLDFEGKFSEQLDTYMTSHQTEREEQDDNPEEVQSLG